MDEERKQYMWDVNHDVGRSLTQLRNQRGLTLEQLATITGHTPIRLAAIERGSLPHNVYNLA